jgi:hypothetical protein
MVEIAWRIDAIAAWLLNRKKETTQATAVASRQIGIRMK